MAAILCAAIGALRLAVAAPALAQAPAAGPAVTSITGAGTTFLAPLLYLRESTDGTVSDWGWAEPYLKETGVRLQYQHVGSGWGIKKVSERTVTFGVSDIPLSRADLDKYGLVQFPLVTAGIVVAVNIKGVANGDLTLDGPTLARIFLGEITRWDDPAIARLNPSLKLPTAAIATIHRSDGSLSTLFFTDFLGKASPQWRSRVGSSSMVEWPVGTGARGSEGITGPLMQTRNSVGYVELAYVRQTGLAYTRLINKDGKAVAPDRASIQAAAGNADWVGKSGLDLLVTDEPGAGSWPMVQTSFVLMPRKPPDAKEAAAALAFLDWVYTKGGPRAEKLDYVPLPASVIEIARRSWKKIAIP